MVTITEKDVEILDPMLEILIKEERIHSKRLKLLEPLQERKSRFSQTKADQYSRYLEILSVERIATSVIASGEFVITAIFSKAQEFYDKGGFRTEYEKQQIAEKRKLEISDLELDKLRSETKLSKWQVKTFWYLFFIAIAGSILGTISFLMQIF